MLCEPSWPVNKEAEPEGLDELGPFQKQLDLLVAGGGLDAELSEVAKKFDQLKLVVLEARQKRIEAEAKEAAEAATKAEPAVEEAGQACNIEVEPLVPSTEFLASLFPGSAADIEQRDLWVKRASAGWADEIAKRRRV